MDEDKLRFFDHYKEQADQQGKQQDLKDIDQACLKEVNYIDERRDIQLAHYQEHTLSHGENPKMKQEILDAHSRAIDQSLEEHDQKAREVLGIDQDKEKQEKVQEPEKVESPELEFASDEEYLEWANDKYDLYEEPETPEKETLEYEADKQGAKEDLDNQQPGHDIEHDKSDQQEREQIEDLEDKELSDTGEMVPEPEPETYNDDYADHINEKYGLFEENEKDLEVEKESQKDNDDRDKDK